MADPLVSPSDPPQSAGPAQAGGSLQTDRPPGRPLYKRILVPTDGSEVSAVAEHAAVEFARAHGSDIVALSVAQPYPTYAAAEASMAVDPGLDNEALREAAERNVRRVSAAAAGAGVACTPLTVFSHSPSDAILDSARDHGCDLIFMGSHGRRGLSHLLAGSETQKVLAGAEVPVMVLRPKPPAG
jgi:nucleotide-binding universal stress UspA family protein